MADMPFDPSKVPDPDFRAPDLVGAVEGWRSWQVARKPPRYGLLPKLHSVTMTAYYWTPRKAAMAECDDCGEDVPGETCACGFYSAKTLEHLYTMRYHTYDIESGNICVVGRLACWGKVIEGSQGWRSQYAYPVKLYLPFEAASLGPGLKEAYGVQVVLRNILVPRGFKP